MVFHFLSSVILHVSLNVILYSLMWLILVSVVNTSCISSRFDVGCDDVCFDFFFDFDLQ